jgi:hypothetical protein
MTMTIEDTFQVGRYRCVARYDGPVPAPGPILRIDCEWAPTTPDWDSLTPAELAAYKAASNAFSARVLNAGVQ